MEIFKVERSLVCTQRLSGLHHASLRVLRNKAGVRSVATDPVGTHIGNYVFTVSGSAARYAQGDFSVLTDLTIGGIIDHWEDEPAAVTTTKEPAEVNGLINQRPANEQENENGK